MDGTDLFGRWYLTRSAGPCGGAPQIPGEVQSLWNLQEIAFESDEELKKKKKTNIRQSIFYTRSWIIKANVCSTSWNYRNSALWKYNKKDLQCNPPIRAHCIIVCYALCIGLLALIYITWESTRTSMLWHLVIILNNNLQSEVVCIVLYDVFFSPFESEVCNSSCLLTIRSTHSLSSLDVLLILSLLKSKGGISVNSYSIHWFECFFLILFIYIL